MKLTKSQLKQIVKEELEKVLNEADEPESKSRRSFLRKAATGLAGAAAMSLPSGEAAASSKKPSTIPGVYNNIRQEMFQLQDLLYRSELDSGFDLGQKVASVLEGPWTSIGRAINKELNK